MSNAIPALRFVKQSDERTIALQEAKAAISLIPTSDVYSLKVILSARSLVHSTLGPQMTFQTPLPREKVTQ